MALCGCTLMAETVVSPNQISLNAVRYKITGPVQAELISQYPQKMIIGDITKDTHPRLSVVTFNDWSGGGGADRIIQGRGVKRVFGHSSAGILYSNLGF